MHTTWKGSISFGLVHIPIKLFTATEEKDIRMRQLHRECHSPIEYHKFCPVCNREIEMNEIVKAYEHQPGQFVILEQSELENLAAEKNKNIEIIDFVNLEEIDPIYFNKSYFIGPSEAGHKAYSLLRQAMQETGKIGVAKITMRSKQNLAVIRVYDKGLMMETIFYPDEVRNVDQVPGVLDNLNVEVNQKEMEIAKQLIEQLTVSFDPSKYTDEYRLSLMNLIEAKINHAEIKVAKEAPASNIINLMEALQASINQAQKQAISVKTPKEDKREEIKEEKLEVLKEMTKGESKKKKAAKNKSAKEKAAK
ncbi:Ku protein [Brevibacillus ginsengisoli]|uniref:non-homologous end joining protein Ku n=1 Tax=Brevibacillus ginsengisoli TaxID=363854 RepID=UPI003CE8A1E2